jgi:endonuclease YncB( thermonuclease family)
VGGRDASLEQIKSGFAWHYKAYEGAQSPEDRKAYAAAEAEARMQRVGLWRDAHPVPPWEFGKAKPRK